MSKQINIGGRIHSTEVGNVVAGANEILDDTKGKKQNVINSETDADLLRLDQSKQNNLTFDNTPTENSTNPVTSGGVYAANITLHELIEAILVLIPSAASALNQLADKAFVNSSVSTATATFRGTFNVVTDLELAYDATHEQIATKLGQVIATADNNDYAFVQVPVSATSTDIRRTERYKFNGTAWGYEYDLNTSGFTAAQWEAINSAITAALVQKLAALPTAQELAAALLGKQDVLTFDNVPTTDSSNPVKSGGVKSAINDEKVARENADTGLGNRITSIENVIPSAASSSNKLVDNSDMSDAIGVVTALIGQMDATFNLTTTDGHITLHVTQENGVITSVQVQSSDIASAAALTLVTNRVTTAEGDITSLAGRVSTNETDIANLQQLYNNLQQSKPEPVTALPETGQQQGVIYRLAGTTSYSDYMWNGSTWVLMATYNNAIDDVPTPGSDNLVKSGGVAEIQELTEVKLKEISPLMEDIYTSESDNYLDVNHVATGIYLDRYHQCTPTPNPKGVISRFIYLGNATQVTISGYVAEAHLQMLFLSQPKLDITYKTNDFEATGTSRTVPVPSNSKYLVVCLRHPGYMNDEYDYSGVKVSFSDVATTDIYQPKYLGRIGYEYLFNKVIADRSYVGAYVDESLEGVKNKYSDGQVSSGNGITLNITVSASNEVKYKVESSVITCYFFYVKYEGASEFTNLGLKTILNRIVSISISSPIEAIQIYVKPEYVTGSGYVTLFECDSMEGDLELLSNKNVDVEKENVIKKYLPYTICMKQNPYYVADSRLFQFACNLLFFTDSHTDETFFDGVDLKNVKYVVDFANGLKNNIHDVSEQFVNTPVFDAVINAGDVIGSGYKVTSEHDAALALPFFNEIKNLDIPFIIAKGNHDTLITDTAWASMYGDWAEQKFGLVRQTKQNTHKSTWSYYDIESKKIRVIAIDVTDIDLSVLGQDGYPLYNGGNSWYIAQEQMNWLINIALNFDSKDDSDWGVVCVLHQSKQIMWNDQWYAGSRLYNIPSAIEKFFEVCKAFNSQGTFSNAYTFPTDTFYNLSINADFTRYASTKKWKSFEYTQNSGSAGSGKYTYYIKKDTGLTVRMDDSSGNLTEYNLYVWYEGASDYTLVQVCQPNQEYTIQLDDNIVGVQVYVRADEITGNVNSIFKILENKPHIVCWLNGHEHADYNMTIDGINIIWSICGAAWTAYSDQRVLRSVGTPTQNAFDCMSIDTINRKIRMVRYGAGVNCFGEGGDRFLPDGLSY